MLYNQAKENPCVYQAYRATAMNDNSTFKPVLALVSMKATLYSWNRENRTLLELQINTDKFG